MKPIATFGALAVPFLALFFDWSATVGILMSGGSAYAGIWMGFSALSLAFGAFSMFMVMSFRALLRGVD